ncbi:glycosyl hydrolase family 18 protein [Tumebacillus sp. DT12]|uniref:Glycosyl hydrolase family 18 protein n=1 Tax=Tumebacillus lacus TaxID=2995335 RepID=A0ABT3WWC1_9BACL|nr:glycosyl hydrolase family 18 protein [Tumebacillus lacus]MCX7568983.1 glycosyl hydrolase family 18 protein [Tumebacillus lacus]
MRKRWLTGLICGILAMSSLTAPPAEAAAKKFNMSYLYFGKTSSYVGQVDRTKGSLNVVSPNYFDLNEDGSLKITWKLERSFIDEMHKRGIKVVPYVTSHWKLDIGRNAMANRDKLSTEIANAVNQYNLDGINVDIEGMTETERDAHTDFVRLLREKMPGKEVSVAVAANPNGWTKGWHGSYDYGKLAQYADYLMVMAYDEAWAGDPTAGPVASIGFVERSIQYALKQGVPNSKIVLGLPFYGRLWKSDGTFKGAGVSNVRVPTVLNKYGANVVFDGATQSPKATFTVKESDEKLTVGYNTLTAGNYELWWEDERSLKAKLRLVQKYDLKGAGSWSLDQEEASMWNYFSLWLNGLYFTDAQTHWANSEILAMVDKGWMLGTSSTTFAPETALTRAQAAVILVRAMGLQGVTPTETAKFWDVPANHWAGKEIDLAKQYGFINGAGDNVFAPEREVSREEISAMLARILDLTAPTDGQTPFADVDPNRWSYASILAMKENGVINGYEDATFRPFNHTTRAQMATLMSRIATQLEAKSVK